MRVLMDKENVDPEAEGAFGHLHCNNCIKVNKCTVQPTRNESCAIVTCELNCGFRFHACKLSEHRLLCANEKVACINAGNGCPVVLFRHQRARHLETCPASVVICTMEWNRWPVCSQERQMHVPFHVPNPRAKKGQLDIALALRDQRMLNEWMKVPHRTRRVLRNSLTKCFPAVPLQSGSSNEGESPVFVPEDDENMWECRKAPPGLQSSVCGELYKSSREPNGDCPLQISAKLRNGSSELIHADKSACHDVMDPMECENRTSNVVNGNMHLLENGQGMYSSENKVIFNGSDHEPSSLGTGYQYYEMTRGAENISSIMNSSGDEKKFICFVNNTQVSEIYSSSILDHTVRTNFIPPPPSSPPMIVSLGLDLTLESITRYQTKPKNMYTFLCAQEFRRDEYSWHYKNVHSDIHGGLNGWLEHRCPLAHYGCMYSLRRFYPTAKGATVIHNDTLESFGVKPFVPYDIPLKPKSDDTLDRSVISPHPPALCQLPFEVLRHICRFLDSFSLCNLALTNRRLREVCCSLLEERGLVVQQWRRRVLGSKITWTIAYKRWFFSTAFTPVHEWGFEAEDHMSNHLKTCVCFERNVDSKPYFHIFGCEPDPSLHAKLTASRNENRQSCFGGT
ncbi:hypothetical protein C0J52_15132 [Blattella germanica]|nr:hypothetical protein C0J52_15132 [Blattella germanica]